MKENIKEKTKNILKSLSFKYDLPSYVDKDKLHEKLVDKLSSYIECMRYETRRRFAHFDMHYYINDSDKVNVIITTDPGYLLLANDLVGIDSCYTLSKKLFDFRNSQLKSIIRLMDIARVILVAINDKFVFKNIVIEHDGVYFGGKIYLNTSNLTSDESKRITLSDIFTLISYTLKHISNFDKHEYRNEIYKVFVGGEYESYFKVIDREFINFIEDNHAIYRIQEIYNRFLQQIKSTGWYDDLGVMYFPKKLVDRLDIDTILTLLHKLIELISSIKKTKIECVLCGNYIGDYNMNNMSTDIDGIYLDHEINNNIVHRKCLNDLINEFSVHDVNIDFDI